MKKEDILLRAKELKEKIAYYDKLYYENGVSEISDAEYDRLYAEYEDLEKECPELKKEADSPTNRVGAGDEAGTSTALPKITHKSPLLSIDRKAKEISDLEDFYKKIGGDGTEVILEPKLDGITCNINYENGILVNAATRGNGYIGDLITDNFLRTDTVYPKTLNNNESLEVRGEAIIPFDFFKENLIDNYSNPRNAVAGIMRQISAEDVSGKGVKVMFYDVGTHTNCMDENVDTERVLSLKTLGFGSVPVFKASTLEDIKNIVKSRLNGLIKEVDGFNVLVSEEYPQAVCDGIVIKVNDLKKRDEIGMSEKGPKWAFAYKFKPLQAITSIDHIEWQVGKTGRVTPVAVFNPISLGGTTITKATLNNYDYMSTLPRTDENNEIIPGTKVQLGFGDFIIVERSNDVIPRIVAVKEHIGSNSFGPQCIEIQKENNRRAETFNEPTVCPVCGGKIKKVGPLHFCENIDCPATAKGRIEHFVSRNAMNITGLGESIIDLLYEENFIKTLSDLFYIVNDKELLLKYEGLGEKKLNKIFDEIEKAKNVELDKFIYALSIPNVGRKTSKDLAKKFHNINNFMAATKEELLSVEDIGDIVADSIVDFITSEKSLKEINDLLEAGVNPLETQLSGNKFLGKTFVITGTLENSRDYYIQIIEENGGKVSGSVSKKTDYVLIGTDAGSKETKARELVKQGAPIQIIDSNEKIKELIG